MRRPIETTLALVTTAVLAAGCVGNIETIEGQAPEFYTTDTEVDVEEPAEINELGKSSVYDARIRARVTCKLPAAWGYPYLLENAAEHAASAIGTPGRACVADDEPAQGFCRWVDRFDARYRALVACFESTKSRLWRELDEALGDERRAREARAAFGPEWLGEPDPTSGMIVNWVRLLLQGEDRVAGDLAAAPFCLPAERDKTPAEQVGQALDTLRWAWSTLDAEQERLTGLLRRGISLRADRLAVDLIVEITEIEQPAPQPEACYFRSFAE